MAINFTLKRQNGSSQDVLYPKTTWAQVVDKPTTYTPTAHNHAASNITSGVIAPARLGTGTPSVSTFLRGDGTWAMVDTSVPSPFILGSCDTAAGTAAKTVTLSDSSYVPKADDVFVITFTNGNSVSTPTLNINGTGAKNIRLGTTNASTTTFTVGAGAQVMLLFDGTYYNLTGSYRTSDSNSHDRTQLSAIQVGDTVQRYKLLMEGVDGKYYPLTLENSTGLTKTVSNADFKIGGNIVYYGTTTVLAPDATTTNCYSEIPTAYAGYTFNQLTGYQAYQPIYLKGTIANGVFKLDNSSYTSWFTQTLPTTEDGFVYVYVGYMYSTNDDLRLMQYHPMYEYKDGRVRLYVPDHTHSNYIVSAQLNAALANYLPTSTAASTYVPKTLTINNKALSNNISLTASDVSAVPTTRTINGKALSSNITLSASDVSAVPTTRTVNGKALSSNISLTASDVGALPATGTAVDSSKLNGQSPSYYLNYNNLTNKPTIPTVPSVTVSNGDAETGKYIKSISASGHTITVVKDTLPSGGGGGAPTRTLLGSRSGAGTISLSEAISAYDEVQIEAVYSGGPLEGSSETDPQRTGYFTNNCAVENFTFAGSGKPPAYQSRGGMIVSIPRSLADLDYTAVTTLFLCKNNSAGTQLRLFLTSTTTDCVIKIYGITY